MIIISADRHVICEVKELQLVEGLRCWKLMDRLGETVLKKYDTEGEGVRDLLYVASRYEDGEKVVYL